MASQLPFCTDQKKIKPFPHTVVQCLNVEQYVSLLFYVSFRLLRGGDRVPPEPPGRLRAGDGVRRRGARLEDEQQGATLRFLIKNLGKQWH